MSRARGMLVGAVAMLSLLGIGGAVHAATPSSPDSVTAIRWCC
jgi:hypothetical protein